MEGPKQGSRNVGSRFGNDLPLALRTKGSSHPWHQEFQIVVDLGHRADSGPRGANAIGLFDCDRRRDTKNFVHKRLIHPFEKLPGVRAEGLYISALPFCVNCIEGQARFAAAAWTGDDVELIQFQVEIDPFQVVLARATNNYHIALMLGRTGHKVAKLMRDETTCQCPERRFEFCCQMALTSWTE